MVDAEAVLRESPAGTFFLYKDFETDKLYLSVRLTSQIRHHRITEVHHLFYLEGQPYPYLDSIIFYHRRHKLCGMRLKQQVCPMLQAHLSARVVKAFSQKVAAANSNLPQQPPSLPPSTRATASAKHSRNSSLSSLITSSSDSTVNARL
ncbi:hypothetical protein C0Q70_04971 [Pomacea canaliculata]|uniref:SH2 domain-containing protein n=1 Tax=Pomacea canaliculata TaxID=400727 RepID=A0A2T7PJV0_POMCA|nr:hypothetical protein C0Q70_04971 [Pomacea canaliculata]